VHELKIDRCFVADLAVDDDDRAIVGSIVGLARTLGLSVVAEGVENAAALKLVAQLGCDRAQGFYLCRPGDATTITEWLANWPRTTAATAPPAIPTARTVVAALEPQ